MKVVVDTNIVFSAILNTNRRIANLLIQSPSKINFYTTDQLLDEINKHSDKLIKLSGYSKEELQRLIFLLTKRISFISRLLISEESYQFAETLTSDIDEDDIEFVAKAEKLSTNFFYEKVGYEKMLSYKTSYNFRFRLKNGEYALFNHQSLMLSLDDNGGLGKSLNIHTRIDHLSNFNTYKVSFIGLNGEPSFMNLYADEKNQELKEFSKREIDIIKLIGNGLNNEEIAEKLFISALTVKKHRNNILAKSDSKNTAQLIKNCILQGII